MTQDTSGTSAGTWLSLKEAARALNLPRRAVERRVLKGKLRGRFVAGEVQVLLDGEGHTPGSTLADLENDTPPAPETHAVVATQAIDEARPTPGPDAAPTSKAHDEPHEPDVDEEPLGPGVGEEPSTRVASDEPAPVSDVGQEPSAPELDEKLSPVSADEEPRQYTAQQAERSLAIVDAVSQLVGMQVQPLIAEIRVLYERNEVLARENGQLQERVRQAEQRLADAESRADAVRVPIPPDIERTSAIAERLRQAARFAVANEGEQAADVTTQMASQAEQATDVTTRAASQSEWEATGPEPAGGEAVGEPAGAGAEAAAVAAPSPGLAAEDPAVVQAVAADSSREAHPATTLSESQTPSAGAEPPAPDRADALPINGLHSPTAPHGALSDAPLPTSAATVGATTPEVADAPASVESDAPQSHQDEEEGAFTPSWWASVSSGAAGAPVSRSAARASELPAPPEAVPTEAIDPPGDAAAEGPPAASVQPTADTGAAQSLEQADANPSDETIGGADAVADVVTAVQVTPTAAAAARAGPDVAATRGHRWWLFWRRG